MQKNFRLFRLAIFYRKIGRKMTFDFGGPWNPVDMTFHKISNCFIIPSRESFYALA